jgi:hypothetical protein
MPAGLQTFDAAGNIIVDLTTRITRVGGTASIPAGSTGSVSVPNASQGTIWYAFCHQTGERYYPGISVSGSTISWTPSTQGTPADKTIIFGVY